MTDLTPRELIDAITRSLNENWDRMAAKYRSATAKRPAREPSAAGRERGESAVSKAPVRS